MHKDAVNLIIHTVSRISGIPTKTILDHISEPLNGTFFHFDAVNMVYLIIILHTEFGIAFNNKTLKNCAYWSIWDFAQQIECDYQNKVKCT